MITRSIMLAMMLVAVSVRADQTFYAELSPRPGSGSTGLGSAILVLNTALTEVSYDVKYVGLTSTELAAHIHYASDGSIAHELPLGPHKTGVWRGLGNIDVISLQVGQLFILVHTDNNPGGELRGDIVDTPVPAEAHTWGAIKALYATD